MQNFRQDEPIIASTDLCAVTDPFGHPVIFSVGAGGKVYCLREDPSSESGWTQVFTGLRGAKIAAGVQNDGFLAVMAISGNTLTFVEEDFVSREWSEPVAIARGLTTPLNAVLCRTIGVQLWVGVFTISSDVSTAPPYSFWFGAWSGRDTKLDLFQTDGRNYDACDAAIFDNAGQPGFAIPVTPQIYTQRLSQYEREPVATDRGSGADMNLGIWRAKKVNQYARIGDRSEGGVTYEFTPPDTPILTLAAVDDVDGPLLWRPSDREWNYVWDAAGQDGDYSSIWRAQHPGYRPLGDAASAEHRPPHQDDFFVIVREDFTEPGVAYKYLEGCDKKDVEQCNTYLCYGNWGARGDHVKPWAVDYIQAASSPLPPGTFIAHQNYDSPPPLCYVLRSQQPLRTFVRVLTWPVSDLPGRRHSPVPVKRMSSLDEPPNAVGLFGIGSDDKIYYTDSIQWWEVSAGPYLRLAASRDTKGRPEVYAIGADHRLYHIHLADPQTMQWSTPVVLDSSPTWTTVVAVSDRAGQSYAYAVDSMNRIVVFFQDAASTSWTRDEISVPAPDTVDDIWTYTCEVTCSDAAGVLLTSSPVDLWSEESAVLTVNGHTFVLDPKVAVEVTTDIVGKLTITIETDSLYAPTLFVRTRAMQPTESIEVIPNAEVATTLRTVEPATLETRFGISETKAVSVAQGLKAAISLTDRAPSPHPPKYLSRNRSLDGLYYHASDDELPHGRIDRAAIREQAWRLDLGAGGPSFQELSMDEATAFFEAQRAAVHRRGAFDWIGDLGDLVEEAANDVIEELAFTAMTVADGVKVGATFVIDGLQYVFDATISAVAEVFNIVQAIFDSIKATFEQLVDWLGFLFNFEDIRRTKEAIEHVYMQMAGLLGVAANQLRQRADSGIDRLKQSLGNDFDALIARLLGTNSLLNLTSAIQEPAQADAAAGTNVLLRAFTLHRDEGTASRLAPSPFLEEVPSSFNDLVEVLLTQGKEIESSPSFTQAVEYLTNLGSNPDRVLQTAVAGFLSAFQGLTEVCLSAAKNIVTALCNAAADLATWLADLKNVQWDIPFVSALYKKFTGETMNPLGLYATMSAIGTTVIYKAITRAAPFPSRADLDQFKREFTTQWLEQMMGLRGPEQALRARAVTWRRLLYIVGSSCYFVSSAAYGGAQMWLDIFPLKDPPPT